MQKSDMPKYAETIIVLVKYNTTYRWYITDKELWFLDLRKRIAAYINRGFQIQNSEDFSERFDIDILNENTAGDFLNKIIDLEALTKELTRMLEQKMYSHISDMVPSLYVDFDKKKLISYYPEPASYEDCIPFGWIGKYENFLDSIPVHLKFWIKQDVNLFLQGE
ncbi:hypothetical protein [Paenibacillus ferrarius]|uniref:hypothetical protein n=1 Tax=Paenibacillus ferrarius TaxID=1469647 RepID=UPI0009A5413C|nr:hypothetical protein [Paenibacillus ferrarius]